MENIGDVSLDTRNGVWLVFCYPEVFRAYFRFSFASFFHRWFHKAILSASALLFSAPDTASYAWFRARPLRLRLKDARLNSPFALSTLIVHYPTYSIFACQCTFPSLNATDNHPASASLLSYPAWPASITEDNSQNV
ncbi:hypothetical protein CBL_05401 [Carabus blaptoides fortunei]